MPQDTLSEFVTATATKFRIPGVAVGVWADGREAYACHGVTSVDNPLPVDPDTLFLLGSVSKTHTATTLLRLVAEGQVELAVPAVRAFRWQEPTPPAATWSLRRHYSVLLCTGSQ